MVLYNDFEAPNNFGLTVDFFPSFSLFAVSFSVLRHMNAKEKRNGSTSGLRSRSFPQSKAVTRYSTFYLLLLKCPKKIGQRKAAMSRTGVIKIFGSC